MSDVSCDKKRALIPFWDADIIYDETVMFMEGFSTAGLMLPAEEILMVRSSDLKTVYTGGKDYDLKDGVLVLCEGSAIPVMPLSEYYPDPETAAPGTFFEADAEGHPIIRYSEEPVFVSRQVCVTYRPACRWNGPVPEKQDKFGRFLGKAKRGETAGIVYFGDSITTGRNSSAWLNREPFAESWFDMVTGVLTDRYPAACISSVNTAENGAESNWALEHTDERIIAHKPDLLVYAFGMNDGGSKTPGEFIAVTDKVVKRVNAALPECDILLVATMLPHWRFKGFWGYQKDYQQALLEYASDKKNVGVAPVTGLHGFMLERKEYWHMTGNNVNHPNDFLHRLYAQTVLRVLLG